MYSTGNILSNIVISLYNDITDSFWRSTFKKKKDHYVQSGFSQPLFHYHSLRRLYRHCFPSCPHYEISVSQIYPDNIDLHKNFNMHIYTHIYICFLCVSVPDKQKEYDFYPFNNQFLPLRGIFTLYPMHFQLRKYDLN